MAATAVIQRVAAFCVAKSLQKFWDMILGKNRVVFTMPNKNLRGQ